MNLTELHRKYGTQEKCIAYLEKMRWNKERACMVNYKPKCEPKVIAYGKTKCKN